MPVFLSVNLLVCLSGFLSVCLCVCLGQRSNEEEGLETPDASKQRWQVSILG